MYRRKRADGIHPYNNAARRGGYYPPAFVELNYYIVVKEVKMRILEWFEEYVFEMRAAVEAGIYEEKQAVLDEVDLKIAHTFEVSKHCVHIAKWLKMDDKDIRLAEIIGLTHDLGRFEQAVKFGTMDDRITGNHGTMSAEIFKTKVPKAGLSEREIDIIEHALRVHNAFVLPEADFETQRFSKLIRDADKLDIFRHYCSTHEAAELRKFRFITSDVAGDYSKNMLDGVLSGQNLQVGDIKNASDRHLMQISLLYDMNFNCSLEIVLEENYMARMTDVATNKADAVMRKIYAYAMEWIEERLSGHDLTKSAHGCIM
ncbi:MAG: HD domain-containing protein [Turicibacter sp.]|nr:HD domain-containing protein [Turicibacter sp.]